MPLPYIISWNLTRRCNLRCEHCYLNSTERDVGDYTCTERGIKTIDQIAELNSNAMLILTGGEPLLRDDLTELVFYATSKGLTVFLGTNGTLMNRKIAGELETAGLKGAGVSLDSATPEYHDKLRGEPGAWKKAIAGIGALKVAGIYFQVQFTVTRGNLDQIPYIIELAESLGARAVNFFFLVCTGRGQEMTDITSIEYEETLKYLLKAEKEYRGRILVRARCAPHFIRVAGEEDPESALLKGDTSGCIAGTGYLRITPEGFVTPCPYMPADDSVAKRLDLNKLSLKEIWFDSGLFRSLRDPKLQGKCGECDYDTLCGGCRARALASGEGLMGTDPWCEYDPPKGAKKSREAKAAKDGKRWIPVWSLEAVRRLNRVPDFLKPMVREGVEQFARSRNITEITPEIMKELKDRTGRGDSKS